MRRFTLFLLMTATCWVSASTASAAVTVSVEPGDEGNELRVSASGDAADRVVVDKRDAAGAESDWVVTVAGADPQPGSGCAEGPADDEVECVDAQNVSRALVRLGAGADRYEVERDSQPFLAYVYGQGGADVLDASAATGGAQNLSGGAGDGDDLTGSPADDSLDGGPGDNDVMVGGKGGDTFSDVASDDPFAVGVPHDPAAGTGDRVLYSEATRTDGVFATLDGAINDGEQEFDKRRFGGAPEGRGGDNVGSGIDRVDGTEQPDVMTGDSFANDLRGGSGADTIEGRNGPDALFGEGGGDTLNAQETSGAADQIIDCGGGGTANLDAADPAPANCETINRAGGGNGGGGDGDGGAGTPPPSDTEPPDTSISGAETSIVDVDLPPASLVFTLSSTEPGSAFECEVDGSGFRPCPGTVRFIGDLGVHTLSARARDAAGNLDSSPARRAITVRQRPVLAPLSAPVDTTARGRMPRVLGLKMDRARERVLGAVPVNDLRFAFRRGCRDASDLEVIAQTPAAGATVTGDATGVSTVKLTVCLAESDWLRECDVRELEGDLEDLDGREDFELAYDTALRVTKCRVDYDVRLVRGPDEAFLRLDAERRGRSKARRARKGQIDARIDCPTTPADQDLRVAYGDGYSDSRVNAAVGPRENGPGGWQLAAGYKATFRLTALDRAFQLVNARTFIDAEDVGAKNAPREIKYANGRANVSFRPRKPGKVYLCTIVETGDEQVLSHGFAIDVVKPEDDSRWTTAAGRILHLKGGEARWLTPQEAGVTARAASLGGFVEFLRWLFGGTSHPVTRTVNGEGRVSQKADTVTTGNKVGTAMVSVDGRPRQDVAPPGRKDGICLAAGGRPTVSAVRCPLLTIPEGAVLLATSSSAAGEQLVAAGAGNVLQHRKGALVGNAGGTLIGADGATLIGADGATLIGADGATLIGADGATLIGADGATLVGNAGGTLVALGADALAPNTRAVANEGLGALSPEVVASLIGADGATLIGADGATLIGADGAS